MTPLYLDRAEVEARSAKIDLVAALREVYLAAARGEAGLSIRQELVPKAMAGLMGIMPAYQAAPLKLFAAKIVCVMPQNPAKGLPAHQGICVLYDGEDGHMIGMAEAGSVTEIRTAALAVLASQTLAPSAENCLFVGSGHQVLPHIKAFAKAYPASRLALWARNRAAAEAIIHEAAACGLHVDLAQDLEQALRQSDIITTLTSARVPLLKADWLKTGAHVNAMGSSTHAVCEFGPDVAHKARIVVDHAPSVRALAGEFQQLSPQANMIELADLLDTHAQPDASRYTLFKSVGTALQDLALLGKILL